MPGRARALQEGDPLGRAFSLLLGLLENLVAADLVLGVALDRMTRTPPAPSEELLPPLEPEPV